MSEKSSLEKGSINCVIIDTMTGIQDKEYFEQVGKPGFDKWHEWGRDLWGLADYCTSELGFYGGIILGNAGTGKTVGVRNLDPKKTIYFNCDQKQWSDLGMVAKYGSMKNPKKPHHIVPNSYKDIVKHLKEVNKRGLFADFVLVLFLGHYDVDKTGVKVPRTLGNQMNKFELTRKYNLVLEAQTETIGEETEYFLSTVKEEDNSVRVPLNGEVRIIEEARIPNDYQLILDKFNKIFNQ